MPNSDFTLYDSYKKQVVPITSHQNNTLKVYSCGPTVYNYQHIGNMRAVWLASSFVDFAHILGLKTEWVLNITDVGHLVGDGDDGQNSVGGEDKLEKGAKKEGRDVREIVDFYQKDFELQCQTLNMSLPQGKYYPKATEYIKEQMILSLSLLKDKKAYLLEDGIYFDSQANDDLQLPFQIIKGNHAFTGREIENTTKNPADFALWKFVDENSLQKWRFNEFEETARYILPILQQDTDQTLLDLPNRPGCPGWHSECVAMICKILNGTFPPILEANDSVIDIHFGGEDHIDIHHKNEILQSEALGFHLSKQWIHNKFVTVDGKKMSKSVGNFYLVTGEKSTTGFDSLQEKGFDPLAYRLLMHEHHYTAQLDFTWEKLQQSQNRLYNLRKETAKISSFWENQEVKPEPESSNLEKQKHILLEPLQDNFNTPKLLEVYEDLVNQTSNGIKHNTVHPNNLETLKYFEKLFLKLNLFPSISDEITSLADHRMVAKNEKNYQQADELRQKISDLGYQVDDYPWGYGIWKK
jgi:cysteinyl-tRNA synthetase